MLKNLSIRMRLIAVITFLSLEVLVVAAIGIYSLSLSNSSMQSMYDEQLVPTGQLGQVVRLIQENNLLISMAISGQQDQFEAKIKQIEENTARINALWNGYLAASLTPQERTLAESFDVARKRFMEEGMLPAVQALKDYNSFGAIEILHGPLIALAGPVKQNIDALIQLQLDTARKKFEQSQATYQLIRNACIAAVLFGLLLAALVGTWLIRAICRPLDRAVEIAASVAAGDLTRDIVVTSKDETGRLLLALKNMNESLGRLVQEVRFGTDSIATASAEIAAGNQDLSSRTEQQASSLEETASSMEELTSTVRQNADNARQANKLAQSASEVATKGGTVVEQVVDTMGSINASSKKIVDIISVIDGIAFQTNILALNAAVEAARAGEQGRGFAVVASEVRALAQRSAAAAKEIKLLIDTSVEKVDAGTRLVNEAGATMEEIVDSIKRVTDIMGEITAASEEQTSGIEQVNQAVSQMDHVTQQNASLVEEAAAAAEAMQEQARKLSQAVSVFRVRAGREPQHGLKPASAPAPGKVVQTTRAPSPGAPPAPRASAPAQTRGRPVTRVAPLPHGKGDDWEEF